MANVTARIKIKGKNFEVYVDCDKALAFKKGQGAIEDVLASDKIFSDIRKGIAMREHDMKEYFNTDDIKKAAEHIIKQGEIQLPTEYKNKAKDDKLNQVIDFISKSCTDAKGVPHTPLRITEAMKELHIHIDDRKSADEQMMPIIKELQKILPLKFETKRMIVKVPAAHAGKVYGILHHYIEKEEWLSDGSLSCILNMPAAVLMDFFDKLNGITHGSAITQEVKE